METTKVIWAANRNFPVSNSDISLFQNDGNMLLKKGQSVVWKTNTGDKGSLAGNTKCQCPLELTSSACKSSVASRGNGKDAVGLVDAEPGSIISHLATFLLH
ncbi:hypothetical protein V6N11_007729 [Hibiscus sabdariffa]|uniref:Bulb-type lectin domain-containing protein n=1 Tax=Hibiscus sabdariffa TaxID=183260 RepID=A0ABR2NJ75_9ROSI